MKLSELLGVMNGDTVIKVVDARSIAVSTVKSVSRARKWPNGT